MIEEAEVVMTPSHTSPVMPAAEEGSLRASRIIHVLDTKLINFVGLSEQFTFSLNLSRSQHSGTLL